MDSLIQDLRYAVRQLTRSPGFAALAIATFALGIGPATAVLSFADRLVLSPIPGVTDAGRIAEMQFGGPYKGRGYSPHFIVGAEYTEFMKDLPAIAAIAGYQGTTLAIATGASPPRLRSALYVPPSYFQVLGVRPQLGRLIEVVDDRVDASLVAVISHDLWVNTFGQAPDVVGKTFRANGEVLTVIGVAPRGFHGPNRLDQNDLWMPGAAQGIVAHYPPEQWPRFLGGYYEFVLKLAPGATFDQAQDQLRVSRTRIAALHPGDKDYETIDARVFPGIGVRGFTREATNSTVRLLFGVSALLLIVACANAANLLLFRGTQRLGESAIQQAIGAGGSRLIAVRLLESAVLSVSGCVAGALLAAWMISLFNGVSLLASGSVEGVALNWRVLAWALVAAILTGVVSGMLPAVMTNRVDLVAFLKESRPTAAASRFWIRSGLAVLQIALSLTLLVGSFLFIRTIRNLQDVNLGFDPSHVTAYNINLRGLGHLYPPERVEGYGRALLERLQGTPGIEHASLSSMAPLFGGGLSDLVVAGPDGEDAITVRRPEVPSSFFPTIGIPLLRGRPFSAEEMAAGTDVAMSVIISQGLAKRLFGEQDPLGQTVEFQRSQNRTVIGVAGDARWRNLADTEDLTVYGPTGGLRPGWLLLVRSTMESGAAHRVVQKAAAGVDPLVPLDRSRSMDDVIGAFTAEQALFMKVLTLLSIVAMSLASVGLYALISQSVTERRREIGIRTAVGAGQRDIMRLVVGQGGRLVLIGVPVGLALALGFGRLLRAKLFGVEPTDPAVYIVAAIGLCAVALLASFLPAWAATRVDPMIALRSE